MFIQSSERWQTLSIINLVEAYERVHSDNYKNTSQTVVGQVWKKMNVDFPTADELEEVVRRPASE